MRYVIRFALSLAASISIASAQTFPSTPNPNDSLNVYVTGRFGQSAPRMGDLLRADILFPVSGTPANHPGYGIYSGLAAVGNVTFDRYKLIGYSSSGVAPAHAGTSIIAYFWRGTAVGEGGVTAEIRFGFNATNFPTGFSGAIGFTSNAAIDRNVDPSTQFLSGYYLGVDAGQTNFFACSCGAIACSCSDTGIVATSVSKYYFVRFVIPEASGPATWEITDLVNNVTSEGSFSGVNQPAGTDLLLFNAYCTRRVGPAVACAIYFDSFAFTRDN